MVLEEEISYGKVKHPLNKAKIFKHELQINFNQISGIKHQLII